MRAGTFGRDPAAYDRYRLAYPARVFEILADRCGLGPGTVTFEVGPGTGIATRALLRHGARPMTLVERDPRLVRYLAHRFGAAQRHVTIVPGPFESAPLAPGAYDLGVAASSFHWLPERTALRRVGRALRPGGWWAIWGHTHGDPFRASPFHQALQPLYRAFAPGGGRGPGRRVRAVRDRRKYLASLRAVGMFDRVGHEEIRWTVRLSAARVAGLWATFSDVAVLRPRERRGLLEGVYRVARDEFGGAVSIPMLTPMFTARRR